MAITSVLIGPFTTSRISLILFSKDTPSFAIRDGLVVIPSTTPHAAYFLMSSMLAVSKKNCMA